MDAAAQPVADAFVTAARESDSTGAAPGSLAGAWSRPVITSTDGAFALDKLPPGTYTVRAQRRGGGEAVVEHVAIGGTARLQIRPTGSIAGTVRRDGRPPASLTITVQDRSTGYFRREQLFRTGGHYAVRDLPKGRFVILAESDGGHQQLELELAEGEARTGVDLALASTATLTGRVVEHGTGTPVPGVQMVASLRDEQVRHVSTRERDFITDETGAFRIRNVARGVVTVRGFPKDFIDGPYHVLVATRTIAGTDPVVDLGELHILKKRIQPGDPIGELGIQFAEQPRDTAPDQEALKVSFIDPAGPAARTDLAVGDVITEIDGVDVTGANTTQARPLLVAPPGTQISLALQRGATVTVVLAAP